MIKVDFQVEDVQSPDTILKKIQKIVEFNEKKISYAFLDHISSFPAFVFPIK